MLRAQLGPKRLNLNDSQRRALAAKGRALARRALAELATVVTPDTILGWQRRLVANKYDGASKRTPGRPRKAADVGALVLRTRPVCAAVRSVRTLGKRTRHMRTTARGFGCAPARLHVARVLVSAAKVLTCTACGSLARCIRRRGKHRCVRGTP